MNFLLNPMGRESSLFLSYPLPPIHILANHGIIGIDNPHDTLSMAYEVTNTPSVKNLCILSGIFERVDISEKVCEHFGPLYVQLIEVSPL